jgi:DNA-binding Lrp family transcriptional regulator
MSKTRTKKVRNYFKIFEEVYEDPTAHISDIAENTGLARNTVSKYLREMYKKTIITGPSLSMKSAPNYREYIYFLKFEDPLMVYNGLETFPHVLYHAVTSGDWNTMIVTDQPLDFSKLIGFQEMVHHDVKYVTDTPKPKYTTWEESFHERHRSIEQFEPSIEHKNRNLATFLPWGNNEWKLFHAFQKNMRKKVSPVLRKIKVRYGAYTKWQEDLGEHCSFHTGFYPQGYSKYMHYCFLFSSNHEKSLRPIFSSFPTTSVVTELEDHLLVSTYVISSDVIRALLCIIYDMKAKRIITEFSHAVVLFHSIHNLSEK